MSERDKYDEAIDWLVANPLCGEHETEFVTAVERAWNLPRLSEMGGCLFIMATPSGECEEAPSGMSCGCLTQIRRGDWAHAWTSELTEAIRADERIPAIPDDLFDLRGDELRTALQPFAEWQRRLDREIRGVQLAKDGGGR